MTCICLFLKVAPSILGAAVCEAVAFLVGALTDIPALRQFCLVAATAVLVGFVLQVLPFPFGSRFRYRKEGRKVF